ncbi:DUF2845 domain-containing protein [Desulfoferrobacter suflitae]|uniref:DUF2845 domain-containing protein n=1 Tax=Desulfoferrobacter suflitae TaxID=2865782 RepID=UPI002164B168|nr:DUF2845 domain-containing protein [Desulfoferrobacter suflitae]MCK8602765.1 DUF2845 domain-containing protein [Desulfoferrobacter suflitae]
MKTLMTLTVLVLFVFGCASSSRMNQVNIGMTKQEVIAAVGQPTSTSAKGDLEYLNYRLYRGGFMTDDYFVQLKEGKVKAFGRAGDFGLGY